MAAQEGFRLGQKRSYRSRFNKLTVGFRIAEVLLLMCRHSRGRITFSFNGKTHRQMFLLFYGRHVGAPGKGTNMAFPYKAL